MFSEGLDLATKQFKALKFLNDVGDNGGIFEFIEKIRIGGHLRVALISHLENLFTLSAEEAKKVIDKFILKGKNES